MLAVTEVLLGRSAGVRVLNMVGDVDEATTMGSMIFTVMAAGAQTELEIKRKRITDSVAERRLPAGIRAGAGR